MKLKTLLLFYFITFQAFSQDKGISYQAVILNGPDLTDKNKTPLPLSEKKICLKFQIKDALGNNEYEEIILTQTDLYGLVNVVIGTGERISGSSPSFGQILWDSNSKFFDVLINNEGLCTEFTKISSQQFTAVPFALFAAHAGNARNPWR